MKDAPLDTRSKGNTRAHTQPDRKFKPEFVEQAQKLCAFGVTDVALADFFKVSRPTVTRWKAQQPGFSQAIEAGRNSAAKRIKNRPYYRVSYSFDVVKIFSRGNGRVKRVPYRCIFRLVNRRSAEWPDKSDPEMNHANLAIWDEPLSEEQWERECATEP